MTLFILQSELAAIEEALAELQCNKLGKHTFIIQYQSCIFNHMEN